MAAPSWSTLYPLLWGDATPAERLRLARIAFRIVIGVHILWACGFLAPLGLVGFAWSDEVDSKIEAAIEPVQAQLGQITVQLAKNEEVQRRILQGQLAAQLRDLNRLRCTTTDDMMRNRVERDIEDSQQEYRQLVGERYPLPACKDL